MSIQIFYLYCCWYTTGNISQNKLIESLDTLYIAYNKEKFLTVNIFGLNIKAKLRLNHNSI